MATRSGKTAVITGASAGIGRDLAHLFAKDGHDVVLVARRQDRLEALAAELHAEYEIEAHPLAVDLSDPEAPNKIREFTTSNRNSVEFLVNNAGFGSNGPFAELDLHRELAMIQVNIT
ncbi:MAG: SDR family NAD(P)-dependent oxidoreductase, partial [Deltaproteobacteria bacterium]|nr:SDR family NAD(P)-dependent oxidoreductase [Deltaproteobacteria bacterium]